MIKRVLFAALGSAALLATPNAAMAATVSSPTGFTFNVTNACTVTGTISNLGTFTTADTIQTYTDRQGNYVDASGPYTAGSAAPVPIATVNCGAGVPWSLQILGNGYRNATVAVDPNNLGSFDTVAYATSLDGAPVSQVLFQGTSLPGTGTGASQIIAGNWPHFEDGGSPFSTPLNAGTYTGSATAILTF